MALRNNDAGNAQGAGGSRTLYWVLGVSFLLHAILLSLHFKFPDASRALQNKVLDIVLVNAKSARKPTDAQVLAQANLDGGGDSNQDRVAKTPLPPSKRQQSGGDLEQAQKKVQALEAQQRQLLAQAKAKQALAAAKENKEPGQAPPEQALPSGRDLANSALEMRKWSLTGLLDSACSTTRRGASCVWPNRLPNFRPTSSATTTLFRLPAPGISPAVTSLRRSSRRRRAPATFPFSLPAVPAPGALT